MINECVSHVKGVGKKTKEKLAELNIFTVEDLIFYFPYRHDFYEIKRLSELTHGEQTTIVGKVVNGPSISFFGRKQSRLAFTLMVDHVAVQAVIFNRAFAKKHIIPGEMITLKGTWDAHRLQITVKTYERGMPDQTTEAQPLYTLKEKFTNYQFNKFIQSALETYESHIEETLPLDYLTNYKLPARHEAVRTLHFPKDRIALKHAKRRMIYEEFLTFQLKMQVLRKHRRAKHDGQSQHYDPVRIQQFINNLPFTLTEDQQRSLNEILSDMKSAHRMNRLLQGDVGSGKTIVAAISLLGTVTANNQGALMVPTEILAEQHFASLHKMLKDEMNIALLTGSTKAKERQKILKHISDGTINLVIGTHALIQEDVIFQRLGLVVIDEQHRFGVKQRQTLTEKGMYPDMLFMTATPIPRSLAITAFGDMDISLIRQMPAGRKTVETYWVKENMLQRILNFIQKRVSNGEQAYIVCPLIEESDQLDSQNAVDIFELLTEYYAGQNINVGLLHGQLKDDEKDAVMEQFTKQKIDVLVATTVIEVGVNVPKATIMVIYDAERFGLAQLHQLRGRVGRSDLQSYCILIADPKGDTGKERMQIMTTTTDGFELAEADLKLRGPGDFFGAKQSGLPEFKIADMVRDYRALNTAREDAIHIVDEGLLEEDPDYFALRTVIEKDPFLQENLN